MVKGDKVPFYEETLEDAGRFTDQPVLPFNAYGTMALARQEFEANSGSSQVFWLLKVGSLVGNGVTLLQVWSADLQAAWMLARHVHSVEAACIHAQESELTPSGANLLDGRYAVFGYVVEGQDLLTQLQVGCFLLHKLVLS
jgi:cyclophilin family peptidyl-prolyl cis-trans isomerase